MSGLKPVSFKPFGWAYEPDKAKEVLLMLKHTSRKNLKQGKLKLFKVFDKFL
jgi:hypothetical protein